MIAALIASATPEPDQFAAEMTARQFRALRAHLHPSRISHEVAELRRVTAPTLSRSANRQEVRKWLFNGWNTEHILSVTAVIMDNDANPSALQWSFPQAYYSAYAVTFAFFKTAGFTESSHAGVIKKFGSLVAAGEYPSSLGFYADGHGATTGVHRLSPATDESPFALDVSKPASVEKHIAQFLNGTRQEHLEEKKAEMKFKTLVGTRKKRLNAAEWQKVAETLGMTSFLSLLYRKRIKANYRDIDTIAFAGIDAPALHENLIRCVAALNYVHEAFIAAAWGWDDYAELVDDFTSRCGLELLHRRAQHLKRTCFT